METEEQLQQDRDIWTPVERTDSTESTDTHMSDDSCSLKDVHLNTTLLTDSGAESDNSQDLDMGIPETSPLMEQTDSFYTVTCTVNIAIAILKEEDEESLNISEKRKKEPKKEAFSEVLEAPRAEGYHCIEYNLLPGEPEPIRVDLVMFGLAAKIYMANETKVLKPWREGNQVWVGWSQTLKLNVTRELIIKMTSHKITIRVWDSKDKVSFKARNDRPKAFRLPPERSGEDPDQMAGMKKMVWKLRTMYEKGNLRTKTSMKHHRGPAEDDYKEHCEPSCDTVPVKRGLAKEKSKILPAKKMLFQKANLETAEFLEVRPQNEAASLELSLASLLAGAVTLTDCLGSCCRGVNEGFWNITVDQPLISKQLQAELNPLVITILSASCLPSSPVPCRILKEKCLPVYCQYKFHNMPVYRTRGHDHNTYIYLKDTNVIFTSLLSPGQLHEFLRGPPLEIEVHDRDKIFDKPSRPPAVFGADPSDGKLASVDTGWITETKPCDPYGIAKLDLSALLTGSKYLKLKLPIRCSDSEQSELGRTKLHISSFEVPSDVSMPMGHYIEADSHLKVQVEIARPLQLEGAKNEDCPFGRIVYVFKYTNAPVFAKLTSEILQVNSEAFQLDCYPDETIERVLSGHTMSAKDRENKTRNVLTGFHMTDKALHLLVLEGLKDQAVKRLWTKVPIKLDGDEEEQVTVLYNSDFSFSERLYDTLDVGLTPIYLLKPLETIMREPLLFIRNMVPHSCLEAMKRISRLCRAKKLKEAVHNNLFPSADMVLSLSREFGLVLRRGQLKLVTETPEEPQDVPDHHHIKKRIHTPLDNINREYFQWKQQQNKVKDFIQANIEDVHRASCDLQKSRPNPLVNSVDDGQPINSYNARNANSAQSNKLLHRDMISVCIPFTYPGFKSSIESNQHPKRPDDAQIQELRKPWRENVLHGNKLKPTLSRARLPWTHRHQDFELYSKPQLVFGPEFPLSIYLAGEALHEEQLQAAQAQYNRWMRKLLLVEESDRVSEFKCHMKTADLNKLEPILKDKPMKYSLRRPGMLLKPIPVTSVVQHPDPADSVEREANIPFAPGPFQNHSLSWDKNIIPRHPTHYSQFHFRDYWTPHSFLYKPVAPHLSGEERRIQTFQKPADALETRMIPSHFKHNRNIIETRTIKDITLHMQ